MAGLDAGGFWSYVHADDDSEAGRIVALSRHLQEEYALLTGDRLELFVDRDLAWGDEWRSRIDEALAGVTFFIPVVTPRFFQSEECRRELLSFEGRARAVGLGELLLPILYSDVVGLSDDAEDEAVRAVARIQWVDWRDLRLEDPGSPAYRKGVNGLAKRLKQIAEAVVERPVAEGGVGGDNASKLAEARQAIAIVGERGPDGLEGDELGLVDLIAGAEEALPRLTEVSEEMARLIEEIGALAEEAAGGMAASDAAGKGFAGRLRVIKEFAKALDQPSERLLQLGSRYASELRSVDAGFIALIDLSKAADATEDRAAAEELAEAVRGMAEASRETVGLLRGFSKTLEESAAYSRDLRPVLQRIQDALRRVMDGQAVMDEWVRRLGNDST